MKVTPAKLAANRRNAQKAGRPRGSLAKHTIEAQAYREALVATIIDKMGSVIQALIDKAINGDVAAIKEINDRVLGRASQPIADNVQELKQIQQGLADIVKAATITK